MVEAYVAHVGPIVTHAEAKAAGLKRYFHGRPCRSGHLSERYTSNQQCVACVDAYSVKWKAENNARFYAYSAEYRHSNKERETARSLAWRAANRERFDANATAWQARNRESINARNDVWRRANFKAYTAARHIREELRKDIIKALKDAWRKRNPERLRTYVHNRRARLKASGGSHTPEQIKAMAGLQRHKCPNCKTSIKNGYEVDHIVPISKGGSSDISNIQLLCKRCNRRKHTKDPIVWAMEHGRLL